MSRLAERHPVSLFLLLTFTCSWTLWVASDVLSRTGEYRPDAMWLVAQVGVFAPGLATLFVGSLARPAARRPAVRILFSTYLPAILLGAVIATRGFSDLSRVGAPWTFLAVLLAVAALAVLEALGFNLVYGGSLGEELGWRGFLLPRLLRDRTPLGASLVVGFWWALWHAPIDFVQGFVVAGFGGVLARQVWALPLAVLFTWVTVRAGGSLIPAIAFHAVINAVPDFALAAPARYEAALAAFFVVGLVLAVAVVAVDPVMLRRPDRDGV